MRKILVLVSFLALFTGNLAADPAPEVEALDAANAPFAITSVKGEYADEEKTLTIRTRLSTSSDVPGALLRIAIVTKDGVCRLKGAFRRDLTASDREWPVTLRKIESSDKVFVSADLAPTRETAAEGKRAYGDLLAKALDKRGMKPVLGGCMSECRYFQAECSSYCGSLGYGSCTDCWSLQASTCDCMICSCRPGIADCDDQPCHP